jgi:peroxiredoxin
MRRRSDTLQPGAPAPGFELPDISGRRRTLRDLLGTGTLLLAFDRGTW